VKIGNATVNIFKIRNRRGYAALCADNLTEGATREQAFARMVKAMRRTQRKTK
jgi:hypothetical protein